MNKTFLYMLVSTLSFAVVNICVKYLDHFSAYQLVFFRSLGSLSISYFQLRYLKISPLGNNKPYLILRGVSGVLALMLFFQLVKQVSLGTAVTLQYLSPIFTALIGVYLLKEKVHSRAWMALIGCLAGIVLMKIGDLELNYIGLLMGVGAAALAGLAYNCVRMCKDTDHPLVCVFYFPFFGVPIALIAGWDEWIWPLWYEWGWVFVLGAFTQFAQLLMTKALQMDKAANVSVFKYLGIVHAFLLGWLVFGESISWYSFLGVTILLGSMVLFSHFSKTKASN